MAHAELHKLFAERLVLRQTMDGSPLATVEYRRLSHLLALRIHAAERRYGVAQWRFRVCATCGQLQAGDDSATKCLGLCITRIEAWSRFGVDRVVIVEN